MWPTFEGRGWDWMLVAAGGVNVCCSVLLGLAVDAASVERRDALVVLLGLMLTVLGSCEIDGGHEETPWYEYDGAFRGG